MGHDFPNVRDGHISGKAIGRKEQYITDTEVSCRNTRSHPIAQCSYRLCKSSLRINVILSYLGECIFVKNKRTAISSVSYPIGMCADDTNQQCRRKALFKPGFPAFLPNADICRTKYALDEHSFVHPVVPSEAYEFVRPNRRLTRKLRGDFSVGYTADAIGYDKTLVVKVRKVIFLCLPCPLELACGKNVRVLGFMKGTRKWISKLHETNIAWYLPGMFAYVSAFVYRRATSSQLTTCHHALM